MYTSFKKTIQTFTLGTLDVLSVNSQVIYRGLSPWSSVDPYGPVAQDQLMITNLRVKLLQRQQCPCLTKSSEVPVHPPDHYAIYDFIVKGSCLCNGHADQCIPARSYQPNQQGVANMVSPTFSPNETSEQRVGIDALL